MYLCSQVEQNILVAASSMEEKLMQNMTPNKNPDICHLKCAAAGADRWRLYSTTKFNSFAHAVPYPAVPFTAKRRLHSFVPYRRLVP